MTTSVLDPDALYRLRRDTYRFVVTHGPMYWGLEERSGALADEEAQRIGRAPIYGLDEATTQMAVELGAGLREAAHSDVAATGGNHRAVACREIEPPSDFGFLRWESSVGYGFSGAPLIACHWGRIPEAGTWIAWWADNDAFTGSLVQMGFIPESSRANFVSLTGPLAYAVRVLLGPTLPVDHVLPVTPVPAPDPPVDSEVDQHTALVYTVLGTWALLEPRPAITCTWHQPSAVQTAADRGDGLTPTPVILITRASPPIWSD